MGLIPEGSPVAATLGDMRSAMRNRPDYGPATDRMFKRKRAYRGAGRSPEMEEAFRQNVIDAAKARGRP